jgi:hypothetical protein
MQCSNHLKQYGLAIHNYENAQSALPPLHLGRHKMSLFGFIFPYHEQQALYDILIARSPSLDTTMPAWWSDRDVWGYGPANSATADQRNAIASIPIAKCPSRRAGLQMTSPNNAVTNFEYQGPQSDYYVVFAAHPGSRSQEGNPNPDGVGGTRWTDHWGSAATQDGPFRTGSVRGYNAGQNAWSDNARFTSWESRDTIGWWQDGTTNQIIFGEKHIPQSMLGQCRLEGIHVGAGVTPLLDRKSLVDCSYLQMHGHERGIFTMAPTPDRNTAITGSLPIARGPSHYDGNSNEYTWQMGFGSWHPGICHFLLGDGSVRAFSVTTDPTLLVRLSIVNDGNAVTLP